MEKQQIYQYVAIFLLVLLIVTGCNKTEAPIAPEGTLAEVNKTLAKNLGTDWTKNPTNGHYYRLTEPMNWMEAEAQAEELGGHLVTINNSSEEAWLISQFGTLMPFWIGFNDLAEEGNWVWVSGEPVTYTNWAPGEPNNYCGVPPPPIGTPENAAAVFWYPGLGEYRWNDVPEIVTYPFGIVEKQTLEVVIDIKPGSYPNSINPLSKGVIPVAILTTEDFDATTVDPLSVEFGPNGASESHGRGHIEDVDGDNDLDLVLHFKTHETGIQCGDAAASLTGETFSGQAIEGSDSINTVGCK